MTCCGKLCTSNVRQHLAAIGVGHGALTTGILLAWGSLAIPQLISEPDTLGKISGNQAAWISNISLLGALIGALPTGFLVDKYGRRLPILISCFPILVGWIIMSLANSAGLLYFGRFLAGIPGGSLSVILPLYLTEFAETRLRGKIGYSLTQHFFAGALFVTIIGNVIGLHWMVLGLKSIPISILLFIAAYFLPESPRYLFDIGENGRGSDALKWFRTTSDPESVEMEIKEMESARIETINLDDQIRSTEGSRSTLAKQVGIPAILMLLQQLSCGAHLIFGIISISDAVTGKTMTDTSMRLTITITAVVTLAISSHFADRIGRRPLLIASCILMSLSIFSLGLGIYIQSDENSDDVLNRLKWVKLISFTVYICAFSFGLGPISWLLMAELVPARGQKGLWSSVIVTFNWLPACILGIYFPMFAYFLTLPGFLWFCAIVCIIAALFSYLFVPETSKRSLTEIQTFFEDTLKMEYPI